MIEKIINIALVDDHALFRSGIANLLQEFSDIKLVFEAENGKDLQNKLPLHAAINVILMDITMPSMDGYAATAWVKEQYPSVHVIALSMFDDEAAIIKMLKAGAGGYILKESSIIEVHKAITEIMKRGFYNNDLLSGKLINSIQKKTEPADSKNLFPLTLKETEFLIHCASELTYKEIADEMGIAVRSVDNYRQTLFEKLNIKSRVGLALEAIKRGLVKV
ncbi:MAG: response regulator transcription factor [Flavobacterium sp.]|nr:response regulator transcription factor [Flavobacterium sp.]